MFDMPFILQSPLAVLGLLSLLIPLGIHLLSKAQPRVIAFAHIAFIQVKTSPVLRQLRLTQLILLGLRMCILLIATLILAQLYWQHESNSAKQQSHVLLTEDWLNHSTDAEKQILMDQAHDANLVLLGIKNRNINTTELAQWSTNTQQTPVLNIWSKVANYITQLSANEMVTVYTTNRLKQFIGAKIVLPERVKWYVKTIPVANVTQQYSANIKVIYDASSEPLLVYIRAALEAINTHEHLNIRATYTLKNGTLEDSKHLLEYDKIIDLSQHNLTPQHSHFDEQWQLTYITQQALTNIKQADFVLTLARLLYSSQSQVWWLENTRLTTEQINQSPLMSNAPKTLTSDKELLDKTTHSTSLHIWLVLILVALFILERLLSEWPNHRLKSGLDQ
ncbi:BatA domain-containing protein [Paraglaciecola psychrophila]|jgi:hypothetical protein|uniref:Aerotolerance regulator N-terminal domain-containing protein n=1 Tax=Paraglaciecola psychrophila 170 TaxID=1129794 RepID=K7A9W1_9ALTE|nr:BatA domain-containing protein [Paraglaciecola psychrophila]AGH43061.1 hypothetical protein C427_0952 [Paraglaciecola psychrophila 170]GAC39087.1 hypothetical protein GPSY_3476 [Paraglaciecola psychrophila 170]